jgi:hypothetical protein
MKIFRHLNLLPIALLCNLIYSTSSFPATANPPSSETLEKNQVWVAQQPIPSSGDFSHFFETGRLRSEDRILFQKPPDGIIPVREKSNSWQFIIFKAGGCSFWMPPGVLTEEKVVLETTVGQLSFRTLASNSEDSRYLIGYAESLTDEQVKNPQILLEAISNKAVLSGGFKLKDKQSITLDSYPGQELTFEGTDESLTIRVYLVGQQVYVLGGRHPKDDPEPRRTRAFLNAFQLLSRS